MGWSFPSISYPKQCTYTQTHGVRPDVAMLLCNPQAGPFPRLGTLTLTWSADTITLPDCQLDLANITYDTEAFSVRIPCLDRRWRWEFAAPISGHYNTMIGGVYVTAFKKNLRELITLLLTALGESSITVTAVPTTIYPEVRWECEDVREALEHLLELYGFALALNFGSEAVVVHQRGVGTTLPATNITSASFTFDPKIRPRWVRTCFNTSVIQARFLLEAVALETDDTFVPADTVSYAPAAGWESEDPEILPQTRIAQSDDTYNRAMLTVFRAYRVKAFSTDTLVVPSLPSADAITLSDITQVLPFDNRLLETEQVMAGQARRRPIRVWAKHDMKVRVKGQPGFARELVEADTEVTRYQYSWDGETGLLIFEEPLFFTTDLGFQYAEVYLEATFPIYNEATNAPYHYEKDVSFDASGTGYLTHRMPERRAETIVNYPSTGSGANLHIPDGTLTTNQTALDTEATAIAASLVSAFYDTAGQVIIYSIPKLAIRCDGVITQVQHIMTEGVREHPVNRTRAARFIEFDRGIPTRLQRVTHAKGVMDVARDRPARALLKRKERADD